MNKFIFTEKAAKNLQQLPKEDQERILKKLQYFKNHPEILTVAKAIEDMYPITHRLRVGNYRLLLHLSLKNQNSCEFDILKIGHRREIYN